MEKVINRIREIRKEKNISHDAMAYDLNISQVAYSKLERGETKLTVDRLFEIAKILGVKVSDLTDDKASVNQEIHDIHDNENVTTIGNQNIETLNKDANRELFQELLKSKDDQIAQLKEYVEFLKNK